jgi:5-methylcytosine-specific restriction endonuclease McrA
MIASVRRNGSRKNTHPATTNGHGRVQTPRVDRSSALHVNVLALNRHYVAVHVMSVQRAFCLLCKGTAEVISLENGQFLTYGFEDWCENSVLKSSEESSSDLDDWIRTVSFDIQVPRIIRLLSYDRVPRNTVKFNRRNIFLRDEHRCQYCGEHYPRHQLSLDHVMPRSRGGGDSWENMVCACLTCNVRKGGRTPREAGMSLLRQPVKPRSSPLLSRQLDHEKYASWEQFVPHTNGSES